MFFYGTSESTIIHYIYHYTTNTFNSHKQSCHDLTQTKITHFILRKIWLASKEQYFDALYYLNTIQNVLYILGTLTT